MNSSMKADFVAFLFQLLQHGNFFGIQAVGAGDKEGGFGVVFPEKRPQFVPFFDKMVIE